VDKLSEVLNHFSISAGVFYAGNLCGLSAFSEDGIEEGHLHLLEQGKMTVIDQDGTRILIDEPAVLFFPRPAFHRLQAERRDNAQIICASVRYGTGTRNPLANALPPLIVIKLSSAPTLKAATRLLFEEAFTDNDGRLAMMDRLAEVFVIHLLRYVLEQDMVNEGMLAGLTHPKLSKAIMAIHASPAQNWSLEALAELSAMSRSAFAELFRQQVGQTVGDYLLDWRIAIAQNLLKKGRSVSWVAGEVGYDNASALARAFRKKTGQSPKQWLTASTTADS
jgi:AraC-like DNA-binding protein